MGRVLPFCVNHFRWLIVGEPRKRNQIRFYSLFCCSFARSRSQIDVFRSIRDEEGNQLTHNFRPIQPLGDRVVFYVAPTSTANEIDVELDGLAPPITEPPQNIDLHGQVNHDKFQGQLEEETPDDIDRDVKKIEHDTNALDTDTPSHPKNTKKHKNNGSINTISSVALIMSAFAWMSFSFARWERGAISRSCNEFIYW